MLEICTFVLSDPNFLRAFSQTVIIIFIGFFFMRKGLVHASAKKVLSTFIWKLAVPCFAFAAFMQDFDWESFRFSLVEFGLAAVFYVILIALGKLLFLRKGSDTAWIAGLMFAIGQTTLFSMPILKSVYQNQSQEVMLYISTISIVFRIFVYMVGMTIISGQKITMEELFPQLKKVFFNPVMIGMFLGIFVFLTQNRIPALRVDKSLPVLYSTVTVLASMTSPLCMLLIGMTIGEARLSECLGDPTAWIIALLRNAVAPVIVALLCLLLHAVGLVHFSEYSLVAMVIAFSAPVSVTLSIACMKYHREEVLASRTCVISTLLTLVTFPLSFVLVHLVLQWM